jgi:large subunit ribosomal protein L10
MEKFGRETRDLMFDELKRRFEENPNVFVTSFSNIKVTDLQGLRATLKDNSSEYMVVKNTITHRVLKELEQEDLLAMVNGMCGVVFVGDDPIATSKILVDFKKTHEGLDIKGGFFEGATVSLDKIKQLSALPPRPVLLGMVASAMCSPISGLVNSLAGVMRKFAYAINAIKEKKENNENKEAGS